MAFRRGDPSLLCLVPRGEAALGFLGVTGPARYAFLSIPAVGMILFVRAVRARNSDCGTMNPAISRYMSRLMACMLAYIALLVLAALGREALTLSGMPLAVLRLLPVVPVLGCIAVIGRYLIEEQDEYLRMQAARSSLIGTGLLLAVATVWGFLEQAGLAGHAPTGYAFIFWCIGMGLGQAFQQVRK